MKPLIIDTNIIFAAVHKNQGRVSQFFFYSQDFQFLTPNTMAIELFTHKEKILVKSKARIEDFHFAFSKVIHRLHFVNEATISIENFLEAYHLCKNIDENDTPYIALSLELNAPIWTRDEILKTGLRAKGFDNFFEENFMTR